MAQIITWARDELKAHYNAGKIWDQKLYKGLDDAFKKIDGQLGALFGLKAAVASLEAVAHEIRAQAGIRMDPAAADSLARRIDQIIKSYTSYTPKWYE